MRTLLSLIGVLSVFVAPIWVPVVCAVCLALRWRAWEVLVIGALIDIVWLPSTVMYGIPLALSLSLIVVWMFEPVRRELMFV